MENVYMIVFNEVNRFTKQVTVNHEMRGAFKTYRGASKWLVEEGYAPSFNDELSEKYEEETLIFEKDIPPHITHYALILEYGVHE